MNFILADQLQPAKVLHHVPAYLSRLQVAHSQCRYTEYEKVKMLSQVVLGNGYAVWVHHFVAEEAVCLACTLDQPALAMGYLLKGTLHVNNVPLAEQSCWCTTSTNSVMQLKKGKAAWIQVVLYDELMGLIQCANDAFLFDQQTTDILISLLYFDGSRAAQQLFADARVRDLVRIYLEQQQENSRVKQQAQPHQVLLFQLEQYVRAHLDKKLLVPVVARHFHISRAWLQQLCRRYHRQGFHAWVTQIRMQEAVRRLLETGDSVSTIAMKVSDMTFASFSAAFRKYYGVSPSALRKQRGRLRK